MEKIKYLKNGLNFYKLDDFASIVLNFRFNIKPSKLNNLKAIILSEYLRECNLKYPTLKDINNKCRDLYAANIKINLNNTGGSYFIEFIYYLIDEIVIKDKFYEDAIDFFKEIMFNPLFNDKSLDSKVFAKIKQELYDGEVDDNHEPAIMQRRKFIENAFPKSDAFLYNFKDINDLVTLLNQIKEEDIIDFYHEVINDFAGGYVIGNLDNKQINYLVKSFPFKSHNLNTNYLKIENISKGYNEYISKDTTQSYLYVVFKLNDYRKEDRCVYQAIVNMLNSSFSGLVLKVLRLELELVYSAGARFLYNRGYLYINAQIDKKNKDKCIDGINEIINRLHNPEIISDLLKYYQDKYNQSIYAGVEHFDYYEDIISSYTFKDNLPIEEESKIVNSLTVDDILKYVSKMEKIYTFFYKGDK